MKNQKDRKMIVLIGKSKSGKDTFARLLNKYLGSGEYTPMSIASPLKHIYAKYFLNGKYRELEENKEYHRSGIIGLGSYMRSKDPNVFIDELLRDLSGEDLTDNIIITDCRYQNEIDRLKDVSSLGFEPSIFIKIESSMENLLSRGYNEAAIKDSENHIRSLPYDFRIVNDYPTLEDFNNHIPQYLELITKFQQLKR